MFTFYHEGYELAHEFEPYKQQLQFNLQNTRNNFVSTKQEVEKLMKRIRSADQDYKPPGQWTMEGFLYVQEKRPLGCNWTRHYCTYEKGSKTFTMSNTENKSGGKQDGKKKFDKETEKYYSALEKHLNLSSKKKEGYLLEADTQIDKERQLFYDASLEYVFKIQEVQEKKKFEFVEPE
ncbi:unnamed protein product [Menidia menidia]|uniref:(Atlantic silverside) hypothetical protein n=1 Tax=Menidia menidia TaxID=238744 RepID=A0A8S4BM72_9TELE|nr:unnamed protein product [Menidia menidia]